MQRRPATSPHEFSTLPAEELRSRFLIGDLFRPGEIRLEQLTDDRMIVGGAEPGSAALELVAPSGLGSEYVTERHELAVVSLRGGGVVEVDGAAHPLSRFDVAFVGRGARSVVFSGDDRLYLVASPADVDLPTAVVTRDDATAVPFGDQASANVRVVRKYLHADGTAAARLVVGITELAPGSVWNTMPPHVHPRRTEIYLYTGLGEDARVVHLCGEPESTRSIIVADDEAVLSPSWSIHAGAGTSNYAFVWAMAGENLDYTDVEPIPVARLR